jgi:tetratricopeptide (TPR) repeat protein
MTARRLALLALVATALARPLAAQSPSCVATAEPLGADSLVALGRFWHALRAAPVLPRPPRPVAASLALLHARIDTGLGRWKEAGDVLRRVRGRDTLPEAVALAAFAAGRLEQWGEAEAGFRRVAELAGTSAELRGRALVHRALALGALGRHDSAGVAWRRAAQALPEVADWLALRRAALEPDTTLVMALVSAVRSPGAAQRADVYVAQRRLAAGNATGALDLYRRWGQSLDVRPGRVRERAAAHRQTPRGFGPLDRPDQAAGAAGREPPPRAARHPHRPGRGRHRPRLPRPERPRRGGALPASCRRARGHERGAVA